MAKADWRRRQSLSISLWYQGLLRSSGKVSVVWRLLLGQSLHNKTQNLLLIFSFHCSVFVKTMGNGTIKANQTLNKIMMSMEQRMIKKEDFSVWVAMFLSKRKWPFHDDWWSSLLLLFFVFQDYFKAEFLLLSDFPRSQRGRWNLSEILGRPERKHCFRVSWTSRCEFFIALHIVPVPTFEFRRQVRFVLFLLFVVKLNWNCREPFCWSHRESWW